MFPLYENLTYNRSDLPLILYKLKTSDASDQIIHLTNYTSDANRHSLTSPCTTDYTHWHSSNEILLINSDGTELHLNGDVIYPDKGDVILIDAFDIHNVGLKHDHYVLLVDPSRLSSANDVFPRLMDHKLLKKDGPNEHTRHQIERHILSIRDSLEDSNNIRTLRILGTLYHLYDEIAAHTECLENHVSKKVSTQPHSNKETMKRIFNFIELNYQEDIRLSDISKVAGFNESYFCRYFKGATGRTLIEYLNEYRCHIARRRLESSADPVTEIALECGFSSVSYFSRLFKSHFGISPRAYKNSLKTCRTESSTNSTV